MTLRIALIGASGRMGRFTQSIVAEATDLELALTLGRGDDVAAALAETPVDVGLDFTVAGQGFQHGKLMLEAGVRPVIGTSGMAFEEDAALDTLAREKGLAGLVVPNFCLGVWLQQELAKTASRFLSSVEIIEEHHATKLDAPSGTAADTQKQLADVMGVERDAVPIHSVRLKGLFSNQTVLFGGPGEVLRITHEVYDDAAFGPGILASLRYVMQAEAGVNRGVGLALEFAAGS